MSAYLFTGWTSHFKGSRIGDSCVSLILYGGSQERAHASFTQWLLSSHESDDPVPTKIEQIVVAPALEHLFTEGGPVPMDWLQVCEEAARAPEPSAEDAFEHGYWVDCDAVVSPDRLSPDLESLRDELPDDVRSGLNWSGEKQYLFLVSALSAPAPRSEEADLEEPDPAEDAPADPETDDGAAFRLNDRASAFPELVAKDAAVVVRARNSVVAAWLWRRHAATTPLARNSIRIDPWCGAEKIPDAS